MQSKTQTNNNQLKLPNYRHPKSLHASAVLHYKKLLRPPLLVVEKNNEQMTPLSTTTNNCNKARDIPSSTSKTCLIVKDEMQKLKNKG
jgi:hypothetical protein